MNPKVLYINYTNMYIHAIYINIHLHTHYIHGIYNVHECMYLIIYLYLALLCAGHHPCCPSLSLLHWRGFPRCSVGRLLVCATSASLYLLPASYGWETPKECILQMWPWWPPLQPGILQHLWGAETANQRADGARWSLSDQVVAETRGAETRRHRKADRAWWEMKCGCELVQTCLYYVHT